MDIHLTASGTPGQVTQDIAQQLKAARTDKPDGWAATLAGLRDDIARELQQLGAENVQVDLHITLKVESLEPADVIRAFNAGQPLPGAPVSEFDRQNRGELDAKRAAAAAPNPRISSGGSLGGASLEPARRATDAAPAPAPIPPSTTK